MMRDTEVKKIIRDGWSHPDRVEGWVSSQLYREFADPVVRKAWKAALRRAAGLGAGRLARAALDIGTGPGTIAQFWAELGFRTTGIDFSPAMLKAARKAAAERELPIAFADGDAEAPAFPKRSFDVISSRFLLFTLPHPGHAMRRWIELLRAGGVLVLIGHDHPRNPEGRGHHQQRKRTWDPPKRQREALRQLPFMNHTSGELSVVMEAAGLRDVRRIPMDRVVAAREALRWRLPDASSVQSIPFILVGGK